MLVIVQRSGRTHGHRHEQKAMPHIYHAGGESEGEREGEGEHIEYAIDLFT